MKKIKNEFNCCGEEFCKKTKKDFVEVYVCPKCRSLDVEFIFSFRNLFGIIPKMKCKKCFYEYFMFPKWKISKKALKEFEKQQNKKSKKASYKEEIKEIYCPKCKDLVSVEMKDGSVETFICKNCKFKIKKKR